LNLSGKSSLLNGNVFRNTSPTAKRNDAKQIANPIKGKGLRCVAGNRSIDSIHAKITMTLQNAKINLAAGPEVDFQQNLVAKTSGDCT
jgi:hypothetical protein